MEPLWWMGIQGRYSEPAALQLRYRFAVFVLSRFNNIIRTADNPKHQRDRLECTRAPNERARQSEVCGLIEAAGSSRLDPLRLETRLHWRGTWCDSSRMWLFPCGLSLS